MFESDRSGTQQLYVMNADGTGQRRISFGGGSNASPAWSPDGEWIAFTRWTGAGLAIGVMKPDGGGEQDADQRLAGRSAELGARQRVDRLPAHRAGHGLGVDFTAFTSAAANAQGHRHAAARGRARTGRESSL